MRFYEHLAFEYWSRPPGREGEARRAVGEAALAAERVRDERPDRRGHAARHRPRVVEPAYMWIAVRARARRPLPRAARVRRARTAAARLSDGCCAASSSARRGTASPWDFLLVLLAAARRCERGASRAAAQRDEGRARPPDPRHRRLGAPPADAAARARRARHRAGVRRPRRSRVGREPTSTARCDVPAVRSPLAARRRPAAARAPRRDAARRRRAHASRARRRLRRRRGAACAARASSRRSTTTIRSARGPFRYVERGARARSPIGSIAITDALRRFTIERGRRARREGRDDPLRAGRAARRPGA